MTDILTTWTENRAIWNKGAHGVGIAIDDVEANLPVPDLIRRMITRMLNKKLDTC